jgi:hypothetical protein
MTPFRQLAAMQTALIIAAGMCHGLLECVISSASVSSPPLLQQTDASGILHVFYLDGASSIVECGLEYVETFNSAQVGMHQLTWI